MLTAQRRRLKVSLPAAGLALVLALSACGGGGEQKEPQPTSAGDMQSLVKKAKKEGEVTFYGTPGESKVRQWVKAFESKYDIKVNIYRAPSSDVFNRFSQEEQADRHKADLVTVSVPAYINQMSKKGWVADYAPKDKDKFPEDAAIAGNAYPLYITTNAIAWNTDNVSKADVANLRKNGYQELLNPKWKGKVGVVSAAAGGPQVSIYGEIADDSNLGWGYLESLAAQNPAVYESSVPLISNALAAGEYPVAFPAADTILAPEIAKGTNIEFFYPTPTTSSSHYMFISENAPHSAAARLFMEWATSVEGQSSIADISGGVVAHEGWVDKRPITKQEWYEAPEDINLDWERDPKFQDRVESITNRWLKTFGKS